MAYLDYVFSNYDHKVEDMPRKRFYLFCREKPVVGVVNNIGYTCR